MFLKQAKMVYWKKLAEKHECEELKEGVWSDPIQAMLCRKTNNVWTGEHRRVTRKLVCGGAAREHHGHSSRVEVELLAFTHSAVRRTE